MKVLFAASEAVPFCSTGALGDVAGTLPPAVAAAGAEVSAILPLYQTVKARYMGQMEFVAADYVSLSWRSAYCGLFKMVKDGVTWYFIDNEQYFAREALYGHMDDGERFGFFSHAVVSMLQYMDSFPDVIHCHDWQTSLIPVYLRVDGRSNEALKTVRTVLTIHDMSFQGSFSKDTLGDLFGLQNTCVDDGTMLMNDKVNLLKAGIVCANAVAAVSPSYAEEIKLEYFARGLESVVVRNSFKLSGILNGIDIHYYDPEVDKMLPVNYNLDSIAKRKENKAHLQQIMGLRQDENIPVVAIVARLVDDKGLDLISNAFEDILKLGVQFIVVGAGDKKYEDFFKWASAQYPGSVGYKQGYHAETLASVYGGADIFLKPSRTEAGGIFHLIAMRYGMVPVVRAVGGLKDTVKPYDSLRESGTGFTFDSYTAGDVVHVLSKAVDLYKNNPAAFKALQKRTMSQNFSLERCAEKYMDVYRSVIA